MKVSAEELTKVKERIRKQIEEGSGIDFEALEKGAAARKEERDKAFSDSLQEMRDEETEQREYVNGLLAKVKEKEDKRRQREMEIKINEETAAAAEAIRKKYEAETPAEWNEGETRKALRQLAKELLSK